MTTENKTVKYVPWDRFKKLYHKYIKEFEVKAIGFAIGLSPSNHGLTTGNKVIINTHTGEYVTDDGAGQQNEANISERTTQDGSTDGIIDEFIYSLNDQRLLKY